ncbi:MAG: hypothetical protein WBI40_00240 [Methylococcaceae bacterium]
MPKLLRRQKALPLLFATWFVYSVGILSWMALNDSTPPHCFSLKNEKSS